MRDVAIYAPAAAKIYAGAMGGGGAEVQTVLLAKALAVRGLDVAHVVYPVGDPVPLDPPSPTLVERRSPSDGRSLYRLRELFNIWSGLSEANARIVVVRGSGGYVVPSATWCSRHDRAFVFAASNELDFDLQRPDRRRSNLRAYGRAVRRAQRLVVQTQRQADLADEVFPTLEPTLIPSFAEPAEPVSGEPEYFLWSDRMTDYKRPEKFLELAAAMPEARFRMVASVTGRRRTRCAIASTPLPTRSPTSRWFRGGHARRPWRKWSARSRS